MPKSILVYGINPVILKWARETSGYTIDIMAKRLKKTKDEFQEYEKGTKQLTISQLNKLARYYRRPTVIFYMDKKPQDINLPDFRSIKNKQVDLKNIEYSVNFQIRNILSKKKNMCYLSNTMDFHPKYDFLNEVDFSQSINVISKKIRNIVNINSRDLEDLEDNKA